mmetsp:Transcript_18691/g.56024  ORF Transcript_18691/g.56024 Transcript_18691/m.56024 type:complete len:339 (+) Transcript_18691:1490-2506(+)
MMLKDVDQRTGEAIGVGHVDHLSERQDDGEVLLEKQLLERSTRFEMLETLILEVSVVVVLLLELVRVEVDVHVVVGVVLGLVVAPHDEGGGQQRDDHATEADGHRCALVPRLIELFRIAALEAVDGDRDVGVGAGVQAVGEAHPEQCIARVLAVLQRSGHDHTAQHVGHHGGHLVDERTAPLLQCHVPKVMASAQSAAAAAAAWSSSPRHRPPLLWLPAASSAPASSPAVPEPPPPLRSSSRSSSGSSCCRWTGRASRPAVPGSPAHDASSPAPVPRAHSAPPTRHRRDRLRSCCRRRCCCCRCCCCCCYELRPRRHETRSSCHQHAGRAWRRWRGHR